MEAPVAEWLETVSGVWGHRPRTGGFVLCRGVGEGSAQQLEVLGVGIGIRG